jgi:hypothetical protein
MPFFAGMFDPPASVAPNNASYTPAIQVGVVHKKTERIACSRFVVTLFLISN